MRAIEYFKCYCTDLAIVNELQSKIARLKPMTYNEVNAKYDTELRLKRLQLCCKDFNDYNLLDLTQREIRLLYEIYVKHKSINRLAKEENTHCETIRARRNKALIKLKTALEKSGYDLSSEHLNGQPTAKRTEQYSQVADLPVEIFAENTTACT